jgi:hypothetical protein
MKKQMNLGGLVVAAQILGIPGAFEARLCKRVPSAGVAFSASRGC